MIKRIARLLGSRTQDKQYAPARVVHVPPTLYRYRALNDFTIQSLRDNSLYFARPDQLNDILDGRFYVPPRSLSNDEEARVRRSKELGHAFVRHLTIDKKSGGYKYKRVSHVDGSADDDLSNSIFRDLKDDLEGPSLQCGICCFSQTPFSIPMWAHYADNHAGICIEYSTTPELFAQLQSKKFSLLPVVYRKDLVHLDPMQLVDNEERVLVETIAQYKSPEWSYEMEWRLISSTGGAIIDNPLTCTKVIFGNRARSADVARTISTIGIYSDVSYFVCFASERTYSVEIVPAEWAFGPIVHKNSIFTEIHEIMSGAGDGGGVPKES